MAKNNNGKKPLLLPPPPPPLPPPPPPPPPLPSLMKSNAAKSAGAKQRHCSFEDDVKESSGNKTTSGGPPPPSKSGEEKDSYNEQQPPFRSNSVGARVAPLKGNLKLTTAKEKREKERRHCSFEDQVDRDDDETELMVTIATEEFGGSQDDQEKEPILLSDGSLKATCAIAGTPTSNTSSSRVKFGSGTSFGGTPSAAFISGNSSARRLERSVSHKERHCSFSDRDQERERERDRQRGDASDKLRPRCASQGSDPRGRSASTRGVPRPIYQRRHSFHGTRDVNRRASSVFILQLGMGSMDAAIRRPSLASVASRGNWGSKWEFLLSCVGLSVGIGNVWRFPYLAYQNGGGAFLIPYLIVLTLVGKPMYFMELAFGQFAGVGPIGIWNCVPIAKGVGWAMITVSLIVCIYYNVIMAYTMFYTIASFSKTVPWSWCNPEWADMTTCYVRGGGENDSHVMGQNVTAFPHLSTNDSSRQTATQQYWERYVLSLSEGIEDVGGIKWDLALCLLLSWIVVVLCLIKGIKTSGKVVYFAATFPYVILLTLLVTGLLQEGAMNGVLYFITPSWGKLLDIQVWRAAAGQMFFSLSVSMGGLIMYSSYNDFRNNVYRDALVVSVLDTATSIIAGTVTFSILGAMANDLDVPIDHVVKEGPGLAFVAYPEAILRLPVPQLWAVLFFLMLFVLGLDSEFALLENVLTSLSDEYPFLRTHKLGFCVCTALFCYLVGLSCVTHGGNYVLTLMDVYGGGTAILLIAIAEAVGVTWLYGPFRLCDDIHFMLGTRPGMYLQVAWGFFAPVILTVIFIYSLIVHEPLSYEDYDFPDWADGIGWGLALLSMVQIPLWAIITVCQQNASTLREKFKRALRSTDEWGPSDPLCKGDWLAMVKKKKKKKKKKRKKSAKKDGGYESSSSSSSDDNNASDVLNAGRDRHDALSDKASNNNAASSVVVVNMGGEATTTVENPLFDRENCV